MLVPMALIWAHTFIKFSLYFLQLTLLIFCVKLDAWLLNFHVSSSYSSFNAGLLSIIFLSLMIKKMLFILTFEFSPTPLKVLSYSFISRVLFVAADLSAVGTLVLTDRWSSVLLPVVLPTHPPRSAGFYIFKPLEFHSFATIFKGQIIFVFVFYFVFATRSLGVHVGLELLLLLPRLPESGLTGMDHWTLYVANISFSSNHTIFPVSVDWEFR